MTKLQRAKRKTREKWRGILRDLQEMDRADFIHTSGSQEGCGFCEEYRESCDLAYITGCPVVSSCHILLSTKRYEALNKYRWRAPAADLCRWVLAEIDKVKEAS